MKTKDPFYETSTWIGEETTKKTKSKIRKVSFTNIQNMDKKDSKPRLIKVEIFVGNPQYTKEETEAIKKHFWDIEIMGFTTRE